MPDGVVIRLWRTLFARDSHADCKAALEHERLARQWERESLVRLLEQTVGKTLEMADPGVNYRYGFKPNERKPPVKVEPNEQGTIEMLPGLN